MTEEVPRALELTRPMELMRDARTIVVVGVTTEKQRPANEIAAYLISAGFDVHLVNDLEAGREFLGRTIFPSVQAVTGGFGVTVDIVDIFRRPADVPPHVEDAIAAGARCVWMQLGIVNEEAAERARSAGLEVVMDRCTKVEHQRLRYASPG